LLKGTKLTTLKQGGKKEEGGRGSGNRGKRPGDSYCSLIRREISDNKRAKLQSDETVEWKKERGGKKFRNPRKKRETSTRGGEKISKQEVFPSRRGN